MSYTRFDILSILSCMRIALTTYLNPSHPQITCFVCPAPATQVPSIAFSKDSKNFRK